MFNPHTFASAVIQNTKNYQEQEVLQALSPEQQAALFDKDIFIKDSNYAISMSRYYSNKVKYSRSLTISDAMTYACNMQCVYCFENGIKNKVKHFPTDERISMITNLLNLYRSDIDHLDYVFFGGEPLLLPNYVEKVCSFISDHYIDIATTYSITSNGTLINEEFITLCNKYNFKEIRITIDGPKRIHDRRRPMKNGESSYNRILDNIKILCKRTNIRIVIGTVLDSESIDTYLELARDLVNEFGDYILSDSPHIFFSLGTLCEPLFQTDHTKNNSFLTIDNLAYYRLSEELLKMGATITSPFYSAHCINSLEKAFVITPSCDIYKCVSGMGCDHFKLSSYMDFMENPLKLVKHNIGHIEISHLPQCKNCEYLSMCNGGCKFQYKEHMLPLCRKPLLDAEMEALLRLLAFGHFTRGGDFKKRDDITL